MQLNLKVTTALSIVMLKTQNVISKSSNYIIVRMMAGHGGIFFDMYY